MSELRVQMCQAITDKDGAVRSAGRAVEATRAKINRVCDDLQQAIERLRVGSLEAINRSAASLGHHVKAQEHFCEHVTALEKLLLRTEAEMELLEIAERLEYERMAAELE